ncbi:MAG: hypothetical protein MRERC_2c153 [Mycoplasmataceae bacterium RC_NB112A]|nr:MAG: hypothetical protein MRERC_2c153 [Mycoplasmataceae bacterium RC_NB112A]
MKGDAEKEEKNFQEILNSVSPTEYENFYWCPQKEEIPTDNSPVAQEVFQELKICWIKTK